jgi:RHS repeat-associated protein
VDTWFGADAAHATWAAHSHSDYDASSRLTRVWTARASNDATRVSDLSYSYASPGTGGCSTAPAAGQDTSLRWKQTDNVSGQVTTYCYDQANRLTAAATSGGDSYAYTYDVDGNRTQAKKNGSVVQTRSFNNADQLSSTGYAYDKSGNLTNAPGGVAIGYNGSQQMTTRAGYSGDNTYTYAGTDQRELISQQISGGSTWTNAYGRTDQNQLPLLDSITNANGISYLVHDDQGTPLAIKAHTGNYSYYVLDGLGSPVAMVNTSGVVISTYAYDPYGQITAMNNITGNATTALQPYRFAGGLVDRINSGLVKFGMRWYDPVTARWTQPDSLETLGDPSRANRYEYAGGNPVNYVDPSGTDFDLVGLVIDIEAVIIGAAAASVCEVSTLGLGSFGCGVLGGAVGLGYAYWARDLVSNF